LKPLNQVAFSFISFFKRINSSQLQHYYGFSFSYLITKKKKNTINGRKGQKKILIIIFKKEEDEEVKDIIVIPPNLCLIYTPKSVI